MNQKHCSCLEIASPGCNGHGIPFLGDVTRLLLVQPIILRGTESFSFPDEQWLPGTDELSHGHFASGESVWQPKATIQMSMSLLDALKNRHSMM